MDLLNSDRGAMQRSRSFPVAHELLMGTESMVCISSKINPQILKLQLIIPIIFNAHSSMKFKSFEFLEKNIRQRG